MARPDHLPAARALTMLRVALGGYLLVAAVGKFSVYAVGGWLPLPMVSAEWQVDFPTRMAGWLQLHPGGVLGSVVRDLLLPNGLLVAGTVAWLQMLTGAALVTGWQTRLAASGAFVVGALLAAVAGANGGTDARPYLLLMLLSAAVAIGRAGDWAGLDAWRSERRRRLDF